MKITLDLSPIEWMALRDALGLVADQTHDSTTMTPQDGYGPFGLGDNDPLLPELSLEQADAALGTLCDTLGQIERQRFEGVDRALVDYTVRNITTGDEEDIRVLELSAEEYDGFPAEVRRLVYGYVSDAGWGTDDYDRQAWESGQERIRELLLPWIHDVGLYERDYATWEQNVLDGRYEPEATA